MYCNERTAEDPCDILSPVDSLGKIVESYAMTILELNDLVARAHVNGVQFPDEFEQSLKELPTQGYKIAFAGQFQVGKTTLINRVFLKDKLLFEGDGLCTTAVCTETSFGHARRLVYATDDGVETISDPQCEDIKRLTVAHDEKDRVAIARKYKFVRVETPNDALRNYTLLDTPGIDDPNVELLDITTYNQLPKTDLVIYVAEARQLAQIDLNFLSGSVFSQGFTKAMVLLSYNPDKRGKLSAYGREEIIDNVKAQLSSCGFPDIPVFMICYDDRIKGTLNTPSIIGETILSYLEENVAKSRCERMAFRIRTYVRNHIETLRMQLALLKKKRSDVEELQKRMREEIASAEKKIEKAHAAIEHDLRGVLERAERQVDVEVGRLSDRISSGIGAEEVHRQIDLLSGRLSDFVHKESTGVIVHWAKESAAIVEEMNDFIGEQFVAEPISGDATMVSEGTPLSGGDSTEQTIGNVTAAAASLVGAMPIFGAWAGAASAVVSLAAPLLTHFYKQRKQARLQLEVMSCAPDIKAALPAQIEQLKERAFFAIDENFNNKKKSMQDAFDKTLDDAPDDPNAIQETVKQLENIL